MTWGRRKSSLKLAKNQHPLVFPSPTDNSLSLFFSISATTTTSYICQRQPPIDQLLPPAPLWSNDKNHHRSHYAFPLSSTGFCFFLPQSSPTTISSTKAFWATDRTSSSRPRPPRQATSPLLLLLFLPPRMVHCLHAEQEFILHVWDNLIILWVGLG